MKTLKLKGSRYPRALTPRWVSQRNARAAGQDTPFTALRETKQMPEVPLSGEIRQQPGYSHLAETPHPHISRYLPPGRRSLGARTGALANVSGVQCFGLRIFAFLEMSLGTCEGYGAFLPLLPFHSSRRPSFPCRTEGDF